MTIMNSRNKCVLFCCLLAGTWLATEPILRSASAQPPYRRRGSRSVSTASTATPSSHKPPTDKPDDRYFAVVGGTVHTVTGPTLPNATILSKNGKIVAIGYDLTLPQKTEKLDASGYQVYPGLVAVSSSGLLGSEPPENSTDVFGMYMTLGLAGGVTTAVTGNTAAKLSYGTLDDIVVKRSLFVPLNYSRQTPSNRYKFRASLERVRQYLRDVERYEEDKKKDPKTPEPNKSWLKGEYATALKLLRHEAIAAADARTAQDLRDLADLAGRYDFELVVRGAHEAWVVAAELARAGVRAVITPRTRSDPDERLNRPNGSSIENAKILYEHGVPFAILPLSNRISTGGLAGRDLMNLPLEADFAIRGGLPQAAAVRAITIDAARILGIEHRVGSIEVGKDADLIVVDGDLMHYMTMVRWTIVNGRIAYDKAKEKLLDHIRPDGRRDAPAPADYWPRSLGDPVTVK